MTYEEFMKLYLESNFRPPPAREAFDSQEEFEESMGYWHSTVGRNMGLVAQAKQAASRAAHAISCEGIPDGRRPPQAFVLSSVHSKKEQRIEN